MKTNDVLEHYGIKGMKWGVRRSDAQLARAKKKKDRDYQESGDSKKTRALKTKSLSEMSNKELETVTRRLQLEKQYKSATKQEKSKGRKFVEEVLVDSAKVALKSQVQKQMSKQLDAVFDIKPASKTKTKK